MKKSLSFFLVSIIIFCSCDVAQESVDVVTEVVIVGGGASAVSAAIQLARSGVECVVLEEGPWLGGMLTSAGVSAIDGNHQMPSGIWGEFRDSLRLRYGGQDKIATGWVSNTLFEPSIGAEVWNNIIASESRITVYRNTKWEEVEYSKNRYTVRAIAMGKEFNFISKVLIDATELGDVMAILNVGYDIGMESQSDSQEEWSPDTSNDIIQDLTYVAILEEVESAEMVARPDNYDPEKYRCACVTSSDELPSLDCKKMLDYGKLPNKKYMINWPNCGNDYYLNLIENTVDERKKALEVAKNHTLGFVFYIQNELGFKNLQLANNEFPTSDKLPIIPYHRESRRVHGKVRLNANHLQSPYKFDLYRTGVAVGDYPIDHHHKQNLKAPEIDFIDIKVPSYNVPLGALLAAKGPPNLIIAEKSISVSNIVNGATRLQPVVLGIGQAAGALASQIIKGTRVEDGQIIRKTQGELIESGAYIMPYCDVSNDDFFFTAIQKIGSTGIIKGTGESYLWANRTWFYPNEPIENGDLVAGLAQFYKLDFPDMQSNHSVTVSSLHSLIANINTSVTIEDLYKALDDLDNKGQDIVGEGLQRKYIAYLLHSFLDPFSNPIDWEGHAFTIK